MPHPKTPPSLRTQFIESIINFWLYNREHHELVGRAEAMDDEKSAGLMFDQAIMPILQKAMDAGELIVGRNTKDRIPVHRAVLDWLEQVSGHVRMIQQEEAVVSKRQCLRIIYQMGDNAEKALKEARKINPEVH